MVAKHRHCRAIFFSWVNLPVTKTYKASGLNMAVMDSLTNGHSSTDEG